MMAWAEMAERPRGVAEIKDENWNEGHRGRGDFAVDVMTIVECVL